MVLERISVPSYWRDRKIKYRLVGGECKSCNRRFFPYRRVCPYCGSTDVNEVNLPRRGKVVSFTVVHNAPRGFEYYTPYVMALIELEDGTRLLSQLTDVEPDEVKEDMEVEMVLRIHRTCGESWLIAYGYKFRPVLKK